MAIIVIGSIYFFHCPCDRTPGGWLLGDIVVEPIENWTFVNEAGLCQIQVAAVVPHSINLNCMSTNNKLYLSCANCDGKYWSTAALNNPHARIRVEDLVYPVTIQRVTEPALLDAAWIARAKKRGRIAGERDLDWWSFEISSRSQSN
jgi:hypothetical protein